MTLGGFPLSGLSFSAEANWSQKNPKFDGGRSMITKSVKEEHIGSVKRSRSPWSYEVTGAANML